MICKMAHSLTNVLETASSAWLKVSDIMTKDLVTIPIGSAVVSAARAMSSQKISCILVLDHGSVSGIITETDMLRQAVVYGKKFCSMNVEQIMSCPVRSVTPDLSVRQASEIMQTERIRRLVVLQCEKPVGLITQTDVVQYLASHTLSQSVADAMVKDVIVADGSMYVGDAAELMASKDISCLVVMDEGAVTGVFTERDFMLRVIAEQRDPARTSLEQVKSHPVVTIPSDHSILAARRLLEQKAIRRLVVLEKDAVCGLITQTDIHRSIRAKLKADEANYFRLLDGSTNCVYAVDLDFTTTYVNPAFMRLLGVTDERDLVGKPFLPEMFWDDPRRRDRTLSLLKGATAEVAEVTLRTADGRKVFATLFVARTRDDEGRINGSQGVLHDITTKKELAELNLALETSVRELDRSNRELQEFAYIAAHDLKTPLRGIGTLADWLASDYAEKLDEEGRNCLRLLKGRTRRMSAMIDGILEYSGLGENIRKRQKVDLAGVLREVVATIDPPDNIEIIAENELPVITCDRIQILRALQNLVGNAIKYMDKPAGKVKVKCVEQDGFWRLSVSDNGPGIHETHFQRIFQMFQTLASRDVAESTGIGLSIVKKIATLHGGKAWVESRVGEGSTFFITLSRQDARCSLRYRSR